MPIQARYAAAWARVATGFEDDAGVLGYDLINEPWPGSDFSTCVNTAGCPNFDSGKLGPFYRRVISRIRGVDRRHLVFYEPNVLFNFDADTTLPDLGSRNLGFSFHDYCFLGLVGGAPSTCPAAERQVFDNADARAKKTANPPLLSEYGATDDIPTLERIAGFADQHMVSWQEWHYCGCDDPTTSGPGDTQALVKDPSRAAARLERLPRQAEGAGPAIPPGDRGYPNPVLVRPRHPPLRAQPTPVVGREDGAASGAG